MHASQDGIRISETRNDLIIVGRITLEVRPLWWITSHTLHPFLTILIITITVILPRKTASHAHVTGFKLPGAILPVENPQTHKVEAHG